MANNFSGDSNCKALWRFENGALVTDSKGGNTLTSHGTPAADTADYKEGAGCVDFEAGAAADYYSIADASLDSGFPLKNGDTNKKVSVCFFFKPESYTTAARYIFAKYTTADNTRSLGICHYEDGSLGCNFGTGTSFETIYGTSALSDGTWYHAGITWQDSDRAYRIRVWDMTAGSLKYEITGTAANAMYVGAAEVTIGARGAGVSFLDGRVDEVVVFNDILTADEIDQIRAGTYGAASAALTGTATASITEDDIV